MMTSASTSSIKQSITSQLWRRMPALQAPLVRATALQPGKPGSLSKRASSFHSSPDHNHKARCACSVSHQTIHHISVVAQDASSASPPGEGHSAAAGQARDPMPEVAIAIAALQLDTGPQLQGGLKHDIQVESKALDRAHEGT